MPLGPDEMPPDQWELLKKYISVQMQTLGRTEPEAAFEIMKLNWYVLSDTARMQDYVDRFELAQLKVARDNQDLGRTSLDTRIAELEAATSGE